MRTAVRDTSIGAYRELVSSGARESLHEKIVTHIKQCGGDWTIGELSKALHIDKSTVSARLNELLASGALAEAAKRKDKVSGITVRPVAIPDAQGRLFQ